MPKRKVSRHDHMILVEMIPTNTILPYLISSSARSHAVARFISVKLILPNTIWKLVRGNANVSQDEFLIDNKIYTFLYSSFSKKDFNFVNYL